MENQKLTKRQVQAAKTKKRIYTVAIDLIDKKGFDNTTIEEISKKANVSVGAFYHYYRSKDEVFFEIFKKADVYFEKEVTSKLTEENSLDQIISFFRFYAEYNENRKLDAICQLYTAKNKLFIATGRYMHTLLEKVIENGQTKNQIIKNMTPKEIADYLFIMARGIVYDWCLHDADYSLTEITEKHFRLLIPIFKQA